MSSVLLALHHLEVSTRLSRECCESLASLGVVTELLTLMAACNRSLPSLEALLLDVTVLLNLAKYEVTAPAVRADPRWPALLLHTLLVSRLSDPTGSLFSRSCCLLAAVCRGSQSSRRDLLGAPHASSQLHSLHRLLCKAPPPIAPPLNAPKAPPLKAPSLKAPPLKAPKAPPLKAPSLKAPKAPPLKAPSLKAPPLNAPKAPPLNAPKAPPLNAPKAPPLNPPRAPQQPLQWE
ncbi:abnormal spindle-like microcephaly-associated protein homolog isoform X4 [Petromyzon marinus]|uniref:abnormal spindle-like microcephaly-associated protein homolog isoform X4 n=1 Tax=Petromyzon marinus TaxID=7757 RepID=UPI003F6E4DF1